MTAARDGTSVPSGESVRPSRPRTYTARAELGDCARTVGVLVRAAAAVTPGAPYHLLLYSAPRPYPGFRRHLRPPPRIATAGGFEGATGMSVTTVPPAAAAAAVRAAAGS